MTGRAAYELTLDNLTSMSLLLNAGATVAGVTQGAQRVSAASYTNYVMQLPDGETFEEGTYGVHIELGVKKVGQI